MIKDNFYKCQIIGTLSLLFFMYACSTTLHTQERKNQENSFIILKNKDTIYGKKIKLSRGFNKIGNVKVVKANGEKFVYSYDKVYQVHQYRKDGSFYVEEFIMLTPNNPVSYTLVDIIINTGNVKLYQHDPTRMPNIPFVVSDFFYGYIRNETEFNKLLDELGACEEFRKKYPRSAQLRRSDLKNLLEFYNEFCE